MRIGGGSDGSFGIVCPTRGERSSKPSVHLRVALTRRAAQPTNACGEGPTGLAAIPRTPTGPSCEGPVSHRCRSGRSGGLRAALPLAAGHVGMHRFVLPAVAPLAVDGELGLTTGLCAHPARRVGLVGSRKVPDGRPSESLVRHTDSHPFPGRDAGSLPLSTPFEPHPQPVHSLRRALRSVRSDRSQEV